MKNKIKYFIVALLMIVAAIFAYSGDIIFQEGGVNISDDLRVDTGVSYLDDIESSEIETNSLNVTNTAVTSDLSVTDDATVEDILQVKNFLQIYDSDGSAYLVLKPGSSSTNSNIRILNYSGNAIWQIYHDQDSSSNYLYIKDLINETSVLRLNLNTHQAYFYNDVSALSFTDRTVAPSDSVDVLSELVNVKITDDCEGNKCQIDKSSLPKEMVKENIDIETNETEYGRDLTYTVSWIVKVNQELLKKIESMELELDNLKNQCSNCLTVNEQTEVIESEYVNEENK